MALHTIPFENLRDHRFMNLTTFRKSGEAVPTPVWFAQVGDKLYVMTSPDSGKLKRIRSNAQVEVGPCDMRGKLLGSSVEAMARILPTDHAPLANQALIKKYSWQKFLFDLATKLRGGTYAYLEIIAME